MFESAHRLHSRENASASQYVLVVQAVLVGQRGAGQIEVGSAQDFLAALYPVIEKGTAD